MLGQGSLGENPLGAAAASGASSWSVTPSAGHTLGSVVLAADGSGTSWSGSSQFSISSGTGTASITSQSTSSGTAGSITINVTVLGTIIFSDGTTTATYDSRAVAPGAPTSVVVTDNHNGTLSVAFTAPADNGGAAISGYTATWSGGSLNTGAASPIVITLTSIENLVQGTASVTATNTAGTGPAGTSAPLTPNNTSIVTFNLFRRAPYLTTDTIGTKSYQLYDGDGNAVGSAVTTGFVDIGDITNAWWVLIPVTSNDNAGGFNGVIRYANINGTDYAAEELNSRPPTAQTSFIICKKAPFLTTDVVVTPQYKIYDSVAGAYGSWVTTGIWAIPSVTNGYAAKITRTADSRGGVQDGIKWFTG